MHWLFDAHSFMPRSFCGPGWNQPHILLSQMSNLAIALAYFSIPLALFTFWRDLRKRPILQGIDTWILVMFMIFITFCGLSHIMDVLAFWYPAYRLFTLIDIVTAISSVGTALVLPSVIAKILKVKGIFKDEV